MMKKLAVVLMLAVLLMGATGALAGPPDEAPTPPAPGPGPAPQSGDGIPDGSGFDDRPPYYGDLPGSDEEGDE